MFVFIPLPSAVVLVIDSINFPQEVRGVSELTFDLLSERVVHKRQVPVLVACNKQDMALARGCSNIQKELEKEMYDYINVARPFLPPIFDRSWYE